MVSLRGRRTGFDWAAAAAALCLLAMLAAGGSAGAQASARAPWPPGDATHRSHIVAPALTRFALTRKITIGVDKSMLIELPVDLAARPRLQSGNPRHRGAILPAIFLLAKDVGDANAFFFGADEQKLVFLEVTVAPDLSDALACLIPAHSRRIYGVPGHAPPARYEGDYGFIIEYPNAGG
jgi:Flp pilus assembly secretin CpaC